MALSFGIFDHMDGSGRPLRVQFEERLELIEAYDAAGFHAYHLAEHHATPLGMAPSPSVFLAAVAQRTKRLRFGALVHTLTLYHPLRLAEEIAMLDQLSGGRLELGIGRGISPHELSYYGVDPEKAQAIYLEATAVILKALSGGPLSFHGKHFDFTDVPIVLSPVQRPHPPLWCGTSHPESIPWMAQNAVNVVTNGPAPRVRAIADRYRQEWAAAGRSEPMPYVGMARHIIVADREEDALALGRPAYERWFESFMLLWNKHGTKPVNVVLPEKFDDFVRAGFCLAGRPERVRNELQRQIDESGINYMVCRFAFGDLPYEVSRRSLELFSREVMPALGAEALVK